MAQILEQEDSMLILQQLIIVPQTAYAKILEENGTKYVLRQYRIKELNGGYNMVNISYALEIDTDTITFYSIYLTSEKMDSTICLCNSEKNAYDAIFDFTLYLEELIWKRCLVVQD